MLKIDLENVYLEGGAQLRPIMVVFIVTGMLAAAKLTSVLYGLEGVTAGGILELYRFSNPTKWFSNPTKWFLNLKPEVPKDVLQDLHGKIVDVNRGPGEALREKKVDMLRSNVGIRWVFNGMGTMR